MARLIKISPKEKRTTIHDVEGIGTSVRKKHRDVTKPLEEYFALRLLKREDGTEYYVEMSRQEALAAYKDLAVYLRPFTSFAERYRSAVR